MTTETMITNAKSLLEREKGICKGDFVTIDNESQLEVYVVKEITNDNMAILYYLDLTESKDDICIKIIYVPTFSLLYLGDSYVNVGGLLWQIRNKIMNGDDDELIIKFYQQ